MRNILRETKEDKHIARSRTTARAFQEKWVESRIPVEKSLRALGVTKRRVIKRDGLAGERNRIEGREARAYWGLGDGRGGVLVASRLAKLFR